MLENLTNIKSGRGRRRRRGLVVWHCCVRLVRSSQVLASFQWTHVLKLSLPRQLHMLFPRHSTHSEAFLIIMQHKRLARTKFFVTRWLHCNDPRKEMTNVHCAYYFIARHCCGTDKKAIGGSQGYKFSCVLSKRVLSVDRMTLVCGTTNVACVRKGGRLGAQIKAVFILGGWEAAVCLLFPTNCTPWLTCCSLCTTPW